MALAVRRQRGVSAGLLLVLQCLAPGSRWSSGRSPLAAGITGWALRTSTLDRPQSDVAVTTILQRAYIWMSLILVLAVLGAVLAVRSETRGKLLPAVLASRRLASPGRASQAPYDSQPAEARGLRRLVRCDRCRLRDGAHEPGGPRPRMGGGHGAADSRVDAVWVDGPGGLALQSLAELGRRHQRAARRRSVITRATTWRRTTTLRRTTCAPKCRGSGGRAPTTSATRDQFRGAASYQAAISRHYFSLVILNFGDTAAADREIAADMRDTGGYYVLAHAGRFTVWASREPARARQSGGDDGRH